MNLATAWTGRTACALQAALRMSNEAFADQLGIGVRTVASWHQKPALRPRPDMQQLLDTALDRSSAAVKARFAVLAGDPAWAQSSAAPAALPETDAADAGARLDADSNIGAALDRLDQYADWEPGTARRQVILRLARLDRQGMVDRANRRRRVDQRQIADALRAYYERQSDRAGRHGTYSASFGPGVQAITSVLTRPGWLDLECPLTAASDELRLIRATDSDLAIDAEAAGAAVQRLAESLAAGVRLLDLPLYRLLSIDARTGAITGSVGITQFARYALTMDLLEGELTDALTAGMPAQPGSLPLRDRYLPDISSVLDIGGRLCAGGPLALSAIARPAGRDRSKGDYVLLIQERSGQVVNAARRLAVIPKAFHQPMTDFSGDTRIGATLLREMEEELFGREDIDNTITGPSVADPMHSSRLSEPMRWLMHDSDCLRIECTGFGLNLVSGTFEFASLIVIDSEEFWSRYGGHVEANWESSSLRQYSSLDGDSLTDLAADLAWSNEGLFAFMQGLRRLRQVGGDRVSLPPIEWELQR